MRGVFQTLKPLGHLPNALSRHSNAIGFAFEVVKATLAAARSPLHHLIVGGKLLFAAKVSIV